MGGQPKSTSHFHTQVKETGDTMLMWQVHMQMGLRGLSSPQVTESKGKPISRHVLCPASRGSDLLDARSILAEEEVGMGIFLPTPYSVYLLTETIGSLFPTKPATPQSLNCHQLCGEDSRARSLCTFHEGSVCWAGFFKLHHTCIFISFRNKLFLRTSAHCL